MALVIWMASVAHSFTVLRDAQETIYRHCKNNISCQNAFGRRYNFNSDFGTFSITRQATAIVLLLLAMPCILGALLGAPLVAREVTGHTNRLVWTQTVSRTRWLVTTVGLTGAALVGLVALLACYEWWWYSHVQFGSAFLHYYWGGLVSPPVFSAGGIVPIAYSGFALTLGTALGAVIRRTSWAVVGTVIAYIAVAAIVLVGVRPYLAPHGFITGNNGIFGVSENGGFLSPRLPWTLGTGYRFVPGAHIDTTESATQIGLQCLQRAPEADGDPLLPITSLDDCLAFGRVQAGTLYMPYSSYWALQWRESAIYLVLSAGLLSLALWSVRRWGA
jgi:hypothetical protein